MARSLELWRRVLFVALRRWGVIKVTTAKSYSCVLTPQCNGYLNRQDLSPPLGWIFRLPSASCGVATKSTCQCPNGWSTRAGAITPSALPSTTRNEPALETVPQCSRRRRLAPWRQGPDALESDARAGAISSTTEISWGGRCKGTVARRFERISAYTCSAWGSVIPSAGASPPGLTPWLSAHSARSICSYGSTK